VPRHAKVGGLRSTSSQVSEEDQQTALPDRKKGTYQFRSRAASFLLSLRRRRITRGPDGEAIEEAPRSKMDNALDLVRFEDHLFETQDPEIAKLIKAKPGFGLGLEFWDVSEQKAAQDKALEEELRRKLEERPDIAARVLKPSDVEDFTVPQR